MLAITNICLGAAFEFHRGAMEELLSSRYITVFSLRYCLLVTLLPSRYITVFSLHDVSARVD
jgi:hypothetical protein